MTDLFELSIGAETWPVSSLRCSEGMNRLPRAEVVAQLPAPDIGAEATLCWPLENGGARRLRGIIDAVVLRPGKGAERLDALGITTLTIAPRAQTLEDCRLHRVFLDEDALTIATRVLGVAGLEVDARCRRTPSKRSQCVQAFESDLGFVTRILAEEGIAWFLHPDREDVLVLVDDPSGFEPIAGGPVPVRAPGGLVTGRSVWGVRLVQRAVSDKVTLRDYDFMKPNFDTTVDATSSDAVSERYEYPGAYVDPAVGQALSKIHLDEYRRDRIELEATSHLRGLSPGCIIELVDGAAEGIDGPWIVTRVEHVGAGRGASADERPYTVRFWAVPKDAGYRPTRSSRPSFGGVQTMVITGPTGAEIHTEELGRSKARFRWERDRPADDTSSAWFRSVQPPTSGGLLLPRVGWEVLAAFVHGSPDGPLELGRLYNAADPPPVGLPAKKVVSTWGTRTTPGGGSQNGVTFDDTAGAEGLTFGASHDFNELTENDKTTQVTADDSWTITGDRSTLVGKVHGIDVGSAQSYSIASNRTVNVGANKIIKAGSESVSIGGARLFDVGGDSQTQCASLTRLVGAAKMVAPIEHQSLLVTGASSIAVGGSWTQLSGLAAAVDVGGASVETVAGAKSIKALAYAVSVKGALTESFASRSVSAGTEVVDAASSTATLRSGGTVKIGGADVIFAAQTKISIDAGGLKLTITPSSVTIAGKLDSTQAAIDASDEAYD